MKLLAEKSVKTNILSELIALVDYLLWAFRFAFYRARLTHSPLTTHQHKCKAEHQHCRANSTVCAHEKTREAVRLVVGHSLGSSRAATQLLCHFDFSPIPTPALVSLTIVATADIHRRRRGRCREAKSETCLSSQVALCRRHMR